jgi:CBS domain containing-hemolysin-like protein
MILADATSCLVWAGLWLVLLLAIAMSALFSAMETGIYVANKIRLELQAEGGVAGAKRLRNLLRNPNNLLVALLAGANLANYTAAFAVTTMFVLSGSGQPEWYALAVVTPVMFILGESLPKNISQRLGERMMYPLAGALQAAVVALNAVGLALVTRGFAHLTLRLAGAKPKRSPLGYEGFAAIVAEGQASGVLTHFQSIMADRVMHIQNVQLGSVMIPMARVVTAPRNITRPELLELLRNHEFSRLPMVDQGGQVVGVLDVYDIFNSPDDPSMGGPAGKMTEPLVLEGQLIVTDALYRMQQSRRMMAIVRDGAGKHVGVATIKDIVEEIVGELEAW